MRQEHAFSLMLVATVALLVGSCGNRLLVKGLTLPAGSVEKEFSNETSSLNPVVAAGAATGGRGEVKRAIMVSFDHSGGWDTVAAHIDSKMEAQGFADPMESLAESLPGLKQAGGGFDMNKFMRNYDKAGSRFSVMLMNNDMSAMLDSAGKDDKMFGTMPGAPGQFTLFVVEYRGD